MGLQLESLPLTTRLQMRLFLQKKRVACRLEARRPSFALFGARRTRPPDKLILGSYVKPLEWSRPPANTPAPDQEAALLLVRKFNPFDKRDSLVVHMCDVYPHNFHILVVAHFEEYSIPFPNYMDKGSY